MSEKICPCCGNQKGCDCYTVQSSQFRRIAELVEALNKVHSDFLEARRERDEAIKEQAKSVVEAYINVLEEEA